MHDFFKRNFKFLTTDTVEHTDGIQKCIRVRMGSGSRGGRGRNRRDVNSAGWRDDKPFDSRGSTTWPYHLGKFLRWQHFCRFAVFLWNVEWNVSSVFQFNRILWHGHWFTGSYNWSIYLLISNTINISRFHLYKENKDTQEALGVIGKMLGVQVLVIFF